MAGSEDGEKRRDIESHYRQAALLHPLRQRILGLMFGGEDAGAGEIAAELDELPGRIAYHLRVLVRRGVLSVAPSCRPPRYHWSPQAQWARKMLSGDDE